MTEQKLTPEELTQIQELNKEFGNLKMQIADAVVTQTKCVARLDEVQSEFGKAEKSLAEKYGEKSIIDLHTGEVTEAAEEAEEI
jgi:hypothetical protein|tara:strand:- start:401 stop:652 length:252 start_codon:yes stop_codon:yes gene_type:complete